MKTSYDVAVIGIGTMGSFALCELAERGTRVIGFDQSTPPHEMGSHSGDTRVFRIAYGEHPDYVPLGLRASALWDQYSARGDVQLLNRSGMLTIGDPKSVFIKGILNSARMYRLGLVQYTSAELMRLFPAFETDDSQAGVFEADAGWLNASLAIATALKLARQGGAIVRCEESVLKWSARRDHFEIVTTRGTVLAEKLIVTAGAWTSRMLTKLGLPLKVERRVLIWVNPLDRTVFQPSVFPVFAYGDKFFYGFPDIGERGVKLAVHWQPSKPEADPASVIDEVTLDEAVEPLSIAASLLPRLAGPMPQALERVCRMKTCLYTNSHDGHFFLDRHPELPNLLLAAGFSGHGFKFAPAIGEALADMATTGRSTLPIEFLSLRRLDAH